MKKIFNRVWKKSEEEKEEEKKIDKDKYEYFSEERKRKEIKTYGIDVFVMVEATSEEEAVDIVEENNSVQEIMKVREVDTNINERGQRKNEK